MASVVRAREKRGVLAAKNQSNGPYTIPDPWSMYFFAQVVEHNINILHVNDLFTRIAGADVGAWPLELKEPASQPLPPSREDRGKNANRHSADGQHQRENPERRFVGKSVCAHSRDPRRLRAAFLRRQTGSRGDQSGPFGDRRGRTRTSPTAAATSRPAA